MSEKQTNVATTERHTKILAKLYARVEAALDCKAPPLQSIANVPGARLAINKSFLAKSRRKWPPVENIQERLSTLSAKDMWLMSYFESPVHHLMSLQPFMERIDVLRNTNVELDEAYYNALTKAAVALQRRVYNAFFTEHGEKIGNDFLRTSMRKKALVFVLSDVLSDGMLSVSLRKILTAELKALYKETFLSVGDELFRDKEDHSPRLIRGPSNQTAKKLSWTDITYVFFEWNRLQFNTNDKNEMWDGIYPTVGEIDDIYR